MPHFSIFRGAIQQEMIFKLIWCSVKEGPINRSSSKNPSTRFNICSFLKQKIRILLYILYYIFCLLSSPYDAIILSVLFVKFCQAGFPACDIRFYRFCSQEQYLHHTSLLENIYYFETRQSFALVISLNGWLKNLKSLSTQ